MKQIFTLTRLIEIALGFLFFLAAYLKAVDPNLFVAQIYGYGVITDPGQLRLVAIFATAIEAALGFALILGLRPALLVHLATQLMLLFYTLLIVYAWVVNGLEDCGCFGDVKIPPQMGILKNVLMMAALAVATWRYAAAGKPAIEPPKHMAYMKLAVSALIGVITALYIQPQLSKSETPQIPAETVAPKTGDGEDASTPAPTPAPDVRFANIRVTDPLTGDTHDLAKGEFIVAMLNMECDHCMEAVPVLNEIAFDMNLPPVVAICWEPAPGKLAEFSAMTGPEFAMHNLGNDFLKFTQYIGGAPPRISVLRDGQELFYWDKDAPSIEEVYLKLDELRADTPASSS